MWRGRRPARRYAGLRVPNLFLPQATVLPAHPFEGVFAMSCRYVRGLTCVLVAAFAAILPARAFAELGGDIKSVQRDLVKMKASTSTVRQTDRYTVHEMRADSGSTVREFATPDGKVFAVAWDGAFHPDYQQLLGQYFDRLQQFTRQQAGGPRRARRAPVMIETPEFVFQSFGHVRAMAGRAYLPQALPPNVGVEEIQ